MKKAKKIPKWQLLRNARLKKLRIIRHNRQKRGKIVWLGNEL